MDKDKEEKLELLSDEIVYLVDGMICEVRDSLEKQVKHLKAEIAGLKMEVGTLQKEVRTAQDEVARLKKTPPSRTWTNPVYLDNKYELRELERMEKRELERRVQGEPGKLPDPERDPGRPQGPHLRVDGL